MLRLSLCDYSNAYILAKGTITIRKTGAQGQANYVANKRVIFKKLGAIY